MAQNGQDEMPNVPHDLQIYDDIVEEKTHKRIQLLRKCIGKFIETLPEDEMSSRNRLTFCSCVDRVIVTYEEKLREIKGLKIVIENLKTRSKKKSKTIRQLRKQLDCVCDDCKHKIRMNSVEEQVSSLSLQENQTKTSTLNETKVDGRAAENEENVGSENSSSDEELPNTFAPDIFCPYASCGLASLLCLFKRKGINFCPTKFVQMIGATCGEVLTCTAILNKLKGLKFVQRIYKCIEIDTDGHYDVLETVANQLMDHEIGLLSYTTNEYNHCVTVYRREEKPSLGIQDAQKGIDYIEELHKVLNLELIVLTCDDAGKPVILKEWELYCSVELCINECRQFLSSNRSSVISQGQAELL